jgi:hypothetical protein
LVVCLPAAYGTVIAGSEGRVALTASESDGSFAVDVAYQVYDGTSVADPLGVTSDLQLAFVLKHQGASGGAPAVPFGGFFVFAPGGQPALDFYNSQQSVAGDFLVGPVGNQLSSSGGVVPHAGFGDAMYLGPEDDPSLAAFFYTVEDLCLADFQPGQNSQLLVLTFSPALLSAPADIVIEVYGTDTSVSMEADTFISLVPEPTSCLLLIVPAATWLGRRRK